MSPRKRQPAARQAVTTDLNLADAIRAEIARLARIQAQPPCDKRLKQVWPAWYACPPEFSPEERVWTLTNSPHPRYRQVLDSLKLRFSGLPFDGNEFDSTLEAASAWAELTDFARNTKERFSELKRAVGTPHPPDDVPHHIYIARLDALGICSERRLREFFQKCLPALSRAERQEFYRFSLQPNRGKDPYPALKLWLIDNVPVFRAFDWRWPDVDTAAENLGLIDRVRITNHESLMKMASRWKLAWTMNIGVGRPHKAQKADVARSTRLLSPPPKFGEVLKQAKS